MDRLYGELAALRTAPERVRHIKRCLHDIVRGDFKRPDARRSEFGESDRESFYVAIRLSSRDVGLEPIFNELSPICTAFKRNNVVRQKLFDAFNLTVLPARPSAERELTHPTALESPPRNSTFGSTLSPVKPMVPQTVDRRRAARQYNADQFNNT